MSKLSHLGLANKKPGRHSDGKGLYLLVKPSPAAPAKGGSKSWVLRVQVDGKRRDVGLGAFAPSSSSEESVVSDPLAIEIPILQRKILTLAEARQKAALLRRAAKSGLDPIAERDRERRSIPTFKAAAKSAHAALKMGWVEKSGKTFISSLETHAFPSIGNIRVDTITSAEIAATLAPIWTTKPDMARKVRQRIGTVLNFAHSKGWRPTEAPGRSVSAGLPRQPKGGNYRAMPYEDVPAFVANIRPKVATKGRLALLFLIYTAARPGEVRGATWGQIDFAKREWNRPAALMKGADANAHTVTLNEPAIALLNELRGGRTPKADDLIFTGQRGGKLSDMTMAKVLRAQKLPYDAHAFRSSFRDWAAEKTDVPDPVAEAALAHIEPSKVVRAYKRSDLLEKRRKLLDAWGTFVTTGTTKFTHIAGEPER